MKEIRLQKFLAQAGVASRRASENFISEGRVFVNGQRITQLGFKINPENDMITLDGKQIKLTHKKIYILLNKPSGFVTTLRDPEGRKKVIDLLKDVPGRVYPVGRLDYDTEGLLILTNDGDFTYALTHPKHVIQKTYLALVAGIPVYEDLQQLRTGIRLHDGMTAPAKVKVIRKFKDKAQVELTIHEGRNRQVRRMLEAIGHTVLKLKRIRIGHLELGKLEVGEYRYLDSKEISSLLHLAKGNLT